MEFLEQGIEYALEIVKFYIVFRWFFGVQRRKWKGKYVLVPLILGGFVVWVVYGNGDNFLIYLIFIIAEICVLFQDKIVKIIFINLWLATVIGVFDEISKIMVWAFFDVAGSKSNWVYFCSSIITIVTELVLKKIVLKINGNKAIEMNFRYYLFFFILGMGYFYIMGYMEIILGNGGLDKYMHFNVVITGLIMYIHMVMLIELAISRDKYLKKDRFNKELLKIQKEQYDYLERREKDIRGFRHDMKDHMRIIKDYCETGAYKKLKKYIDEICDKVYINEKRVSVHNRIADVIINQYMSQAKDLGIQMKIHGQISEDCTVASSDLCIIFANLMKNGVEAAKNTEGKQVRMIVGYEKDVMMIHMKNDYSGERKKRNGKYVTTKSNMKNHGIGMENVRESVEKYSGTLDMREENGKFLTMITMLANDKKSI